MGNAVAQTGRVELPRVVLQTGRPMADERLRNLAEIGLPPLPSPLPTPEPYLLKECRVLGGDGIPELHEGTKWDLWFYDDVLRCSRPPAFVELDYADLRLLEVAGPGATRSGGGYVGGGLGPAGAAEGLLAATVLNALTTRTKVQTVIRVQTADADLYFSSDRAEPSKVRIGLSHVFQILRDLEAAPSARDARDDVVGQLERLATLLDAGHISGDEFAALKLKLISDS